MTAQEYSAWLKRIEVGKPNTPIQQLTVLMLLHKLFDDYERRKRKHKEEFVY